MKIQKTMLRFTFSLIFLFALFAKSYGQDLQFTITNVSCNGGTNNGAIQVNLISQLNCGPGPYQFQIVGPSDNPATVTSPIISSSNYTFSNLAAGNYVINVLVSGTVCYSTNQTVTVPLPLVASTTYTQPLCNQLNQVGASSSLGSALVTVSGGSTGGCANPCRGYNIQWAGGSTPSSGGSLNACPPEIITCNSTGSNTYPISNLGPGSYTITIQDLNNCSVTNNFNINAPTQININYVPSNDPCNGINNGSIDITTGGGTPGYTYLWSGPNGFTSPTQDLSNLAPGTYCVTVTDMNGCSDSACCQINPPPPLLTITETHIDPLCHDDANGSVTVTFNGGTPGYTITAIDNLGLPISGPITIPTAPNSHTYTGLAAGSYTITVTDANGCDSSITILLENPLDILLSVTTTPVSCFGGNDGTIVFNASGGTGTLSYFTSPASSSGPVVAGNNTISNLSAGIYTLIITDQNGCQDSITVIVTEPDPINISLNCIYPSCYGATGAIHITVSGGTPLYDYSWSGPNGFTSSLPDLIGLAPGTYCVTVTDMNGCSDSACCQIIEHPILTSTLTQTNPLCHDDANGSITVTVNGGTPGYTIYIDGGAPVIIPLGQNSHTFLDLAAGFYGITVTCAMGCVLSNSIVLMNPQAITLNATTTPVNCFGGNDGTIFFTASGGTGALSYSTVPASSSGTVVAGNNTISNLSAGIYTLIITDQNGCQESITVNVAEPVLIFLTGIPSQVLCYDNNGGAIDIIVGGGTPVYTYLWTGPGITPSNQTDQDQSELTPGIYCVTVTDANGCSESICMQINPAPPLLTIIETHIDPLCHDVANGSITVTVNGGTPGYTITGIGAPVIIPPGQNSNTFSNLAAGTYFITITDAYGCTASIEPFDITAPQSLTLTGVVSGNDIDVTASGGTPNYVYSWSNGSGLEDQQDLISGIYILIVTDTNGCQVTDTFDVNNASLYENSNESLLLFPNPSAEFLNIHISPSMENNRFVVFDCLGRTVGSGILESKETIISVKHLANGIYHFQTETQRVQFVVAH